MAGSKVPSLRDLLRVLFRRRSAILGGLLGGLVLAGAIGFLRVPLYESHAQILLVSDPVLGGVAGGEAAGDVTALRSEMDELLASLLADAQGPQLRAAAAQAEMRARAGLAGKVRGRLEDALEAAAMRLRPPLEALGLVGARTPTDRLLARLQEALRVAVLEDGQAIRVGLRWADPRFAADLSNLLAARYVDAHARSAPRAAVASFYDDEAVHQGTRLEALESELERLHGSSRLADLHAQRELLLRDVSALELRLTDLEMEQRSLAAQRHSVEQRIAERADWIESPEAVATVPELAELDRIQLELRSERVRAAQTFAEGAGPLARIDRQIAELREQKGRSVLAMLEAREAARARQIALLRSGLDAKRAELVAVHGRNPELARLERERSVAERAYHRYRKQAEDLRLREGLGRRGVSSASLIRSASPAHEPLSPSPWRLLWMGGLLGLGVGGLFAALGEFADRSFQDPEIVTEVLDLPVLAAVPETHGGTARALGL